MNEDAVKKQSNSGNFSFGSYEESENLRLSIFEDDEKDRIIPLLYKAREPKF